MTTPRIAIFYDWLNQWGGAERVLLNILKLYPEADLFTIVYNPSKTKWLPKKIKIIPSFINRLPFSQGNPIFYTPFYDIALEQLNFKKYDIVISTTSTSGYCLLTPPQTLSICYLHNINRHLYSPSSKYSSLKFLFNIYKSLDQIYIHRPDYLFCNSNTVQKRIFDLYRQPSTVIHPGANTKFFKPSTSQPSDYFLVVSRLVPHKKIDLVIELFKKLPLKLKIVGDGYDSEYLKKLSKDAKNITFFSNISNTKLRQLYQHCQALICPQEEDFGIAAIEAQSCGRPVIAYQHGGITETVVNHQTGIFFPLQTSSSLEQALIQFHQTRFDSQSIRMHSLKFSEAKFMLNFKNKVAHLWHQHQTTIS